VPIRFIALRKNAAAARQSQHRTHKRAVKRGRKPHSKTVLAAGYLFLLTSLDRNEYPPERVLALYRLRWQIEMV
jgi:IS4 transposase